MPGLYKAKLVLFDNDGKIIESIEEVMPVAVAVVFAVKLKAWRIDHTDNLISHQELLESIRKFKEDDKA